MIIGLNINGKSRPGNLISLIRLNGNLIDLIVLCLLFVPLAEDIHGPYEELDHVRSDGPQGLGVRDYRGASQDDLPGVLYLDGQCLAGGGQHECDRFRLFNIDGIIQLVNRVQCGCRFKLPVQVMECAMYREGDSGLVGMEDICRSCLLELLHVSLNRELFRGAFLLSFCIQGVNESDYGECHKYSKNCSTCHKNLFLELN